MSYPLRTIDAGETFVIKDETYVAVQKAGCDHCAFSEARTSVHCGNFDLPDCAASGDQLASGAGSLIFLRLADAVTHKLTGEFPDVQPIPADDPGPSW